MESYSRHITQLEIILKQIIFVSELYTVFLLTNNKDQINSFKDLARSHHRHLKNHTDRGKDFIYY